MFMNNARDKSPGIRITFDPLTEFVQIMHGAGFTQLDLCFVALQSCCCREGLLQGQHHLIHLTCTNMTTHAYTERFARLKIRGWCYFHSRVLCDSPGPHWHTEKQSTHIDWDPTRAGPGRWNQSGPNAWYPAGNTKARHESRRNVFKTTQINKQNWTLSENFLSSWFLNDSKHEWILYKQNRPNNRFVYELKTKICWAVNTGGVCGEESGQHEVKNNSTWQQEEISLKFFSNTTVLLSGLMRFTSKRPTWNTGCTLADTWTDAHWTSTV